ncbi:MAG: DUF6155 family protein [Desulfocucumaceae bacterium]
MDIKIADLKRYLLTKTDKELREEIVELFKANDKVKEYYFLKVKPDEEEILMNKYKEIIQNEYFPKRGIGRLRYSVLKKAISDFKKISSNPMCLAELMMTYVENGVEFTNTYGDIDETFYNNVANMYQKTVDYVLENNLQDVFEKRCRSAMEMSSDIGWGFGDFMQEYYYENFEAESDL